MTIEVISFIIIGIIAFMIPLIVYVKVLLKKIQNTFINFCTTLLLSLMSAFIAILMLNIYFRCFLVEGLTGEFFEIFWLIPPVTVLLVCVYFLYRFTNKDAPSEYKKADKF